MNISRDYELHYTKYQELLFKQFEFEEALKNEMI